MESGLANPGPGGSTDESGYPLSSLHHVYQLLRLRKPCSQSPCRCKIRHRLGSEYATKLVLTHPSTPRIPLPEWSCRGHIDGSTAILAPLRCLLAGRLGLLARFVSQTGAFFFTALFFAALFFTACLTRAVGLGVLSFSHV